MAKVFLICGKICSGKTRYAKNSLMTTMQSFYPAMKLNMSFFIISLGKSTMK